MDDVSADYCLGFHEGVRDVQYGDPHTDYGATERGRGYREGRDAAVVLRGYRYRELMDVVRKEGSVLITHSSGGFRFSWGPSPRTVLM